MWPPDRATNPPPGWGVTANLIVLTRFQATGSSSSLIFDPSLRDSIGDRERPASNLLLRDDGAEVGRLAIDSADDWWYL
jgi:hypothetical protein